MKKAFVIASLSDEGSFNGYFNGENFDEQNVEKANLIDNKTQARGALGNLQRINADRDLTIVPVEITIVVASQTGATV